MKRSVILAAFGTSAPDAADSIMNIQRRVAEAFPDCAVSLAFTSAVIRNIWRTRAADEAFRSAHPEIPETLYAVPGVPAAIAAAKNAGAEEIFVQSLHVTDGEEFAALKKIAPAAGAPALGAGDGEDAPLRRAAAALAPLAARAKASGAALVLMAHGNERLNQAVFAKLEKLLRSLHGPEIYIGTVEAPSPAADVVAAVRASPAGPDSVLLAPLMVVAGEHARNDMAGDGPESWRARFLAAGFRVECFLEGLGSNASWADIYVERLKETMMDDFEAADACLDAGDGEKAIEMFRPIAERGRVAAMHSIAHTYLYGVAGVKQDRDAAFRWFTRAAEGGCPQGMYHLGLCNAKGYGTPVNPELSFQWYRKSAERGDEDAMYEVGQCYEQGFGVEKNIARAKLWYKDAAENGQSLAAERLRGLEG